jgi:hypothetical protein
MKGVGTGIVLERAILLDVFVTKGWASRTVMGMLFFGAFPRNLIIVKIRSGI